MKNWKLMFEPGGLTVWSHGTVAISFRALTARYSHDCDGTDKYCVYRILDKSVASRLLCKSKPARTALPDLPEEYYPCSAFQ